MNHGSNTTYSFHGCRCEPCTRAHARHMNLWRMGYTDRLIDATGTHRRIEALMVLGWSRAALSVRLGHQRDYFAKQVGQRYVTSRIAAKVTSLYDELSMTPAPDSPASRRVRAIAARKGYVSPLAWDDDTIDNPAERPQGITATKQHVTCDPVVVQRILGGEWRLAANAHERRAVIDQYAGDLTELERLTGWNVWRLRGKKEAA